MQEPGIQFRLCEIWTCLTEEEQAVLQTIRTGQNVDTIPEDNGARLVRSGLCRQTGDRWQLTGTLVIGLG